MKLSRIINNFELRIKEVRGNKSVFKIIKDGLNLYYEFFYYKTFKPKTFYFKGKEFKYFYGLYNATWKNERAVEIPIILYLLKKFDEKDILEVGNVLDHYISVKHDVVDKYEKNKKVINEDVVDFKSNKKYKLIVSISTIEHVGWDENPKEPLKILKAIKNLKSHLSYKGKMIITFLKGYNSYLDKLLDDGKLGFSKIYYLMKITEDNKWVEINSKDNIKDKKVLIVGIVE